ncbi:DUF309 domain-containing protein [Nocardiopsis gilva YIM 90087]|uniref:DUF309 domain-containing protein n=1 Tax=Nocardiopsis gilva YIM 90087 TaxID=1235441 RepID=A0A223S1E5_9ACTN|nr:DUF309 domain-containing protein [Nocardiopsis gilva]ASU81907.1 DUF309 domain-containing protein [Nocardiopsis gilva YIM 90087]
MSGTSGAGSTGNTGEKDTAQAARDRDPQGRAQNQRPRDRFGRPLPHGSPGVPRVPDDAVFTPEEGLTEAQRLLDDGYAFNAHEVLEAVWKAAPEPERELWRGLAQVAVGLTHAQRGNRVGAERLLRRGAERVAAYGPSAPHGVDALGAAAQGRAVADTLADGTQPAEGIGGGLADEDGNGDAAVIPVDTSALRLRRADPRSGA